MQLGGFAYILVRNLPCCLFEWFFFLEEIRIEEGAGFIPEHIVLHTVHLLQDGVFIGVELVDMQAVGIALFFAVVFQNHGFCITHRSWSAFFGRAGELFDGNTAQLFLKQVIVQGITKHFHELCNCIQHICR